MSYVATLNAEQKKNISIIVKEARRAGITNDFTLAAILAIVSKESGFNCKFEGGYSKTSNARIRQIFSKFRSYTDEQLTRTKASDKTFFDAIYGGRYGNASNEGYKYRGAGFNQITFKSNYAAIGKLINVDLVSHPEQIENPEVAAKALIAYFQSRFKSMPASLEKEYGTRDLNKLKTQAIAFKSVYHANAGWAKPSSRINGNEPTGGFKRAWERVTELYLMLDESEYPIVSQMEGDAFRTWVNAKHPEYAKLHSLDKTGSFTNTFIRKAWKDLGKFYK